WIWVPITAMIVIALFLLFPTGSLPSPRWRWVAVLGAVSVAVASVGAAINDRVEQFGNIPNPLPFTVTWGDRLLEVAMAGYMVAAAASVISVALRYRRSSGEERAQLKWIVAAGAFAVVVLALTLPAQFVGGNLAEALELPILLAFLSIPVAAGIAILKYRLFDIDVVINRAVVYALLAAFVTGLYIAIVVGIGAAAGRRGGFLLPGLAAAVVALVFHPARLRAQRFASRLVYGKRATPYEVLSEFSDRLAGSYSVDDVLPRMARIVGEGSGAARADVWLHVGAGLRRTATWPDGVAGREAVAVSGEELPDLPDADRALPVRHQGELLGALTVAKARGEPFRPAEEKLLEDLAAQAGLVLRNVRLTEELRANLEELRASRQRIVAAQDTERRRLERDIHDGAQQQLVALAVKLNLAEALVDREPAKAKELVSQVKAETTEALEGLRDLARGIYPPLLADRGLVAALEAQARKSAVPVTVEADGVGRYPQEVEAAIYFCVLEALQNVAKYASDAPATVRLDAADGEIRFEVIDRGPGFNPAGTDGGSGLQNMRDRMEALGGTLEVISRPGGGTTIRGRLQARPRTGSPSGEPQPAPGS
ncbi:MAG TPA: GAF domain-containing sensor histidine kinase, partial [Actinomycetota bacterium]|nr:GAF domain-containing sensor histidine kinase [Actinomycetota bacterium]